MYIVASVIYGIALCIANKLLAGRWLFVTLLVFMLFFIVELFRKKDDTAGNIAYSILPVIYIVVPFSSLNFFFNPGLHGTLSRYFIPLGFFLLLWTNDIFAYLTGLAIGRHKLFERLSPKKTWEGTFGGLVFSVLMAWGISFYIQDLSLVEWIVMALIIVIFGTLGDLSESMLKRKFAVKDSGRILPGHGGVLDRFDAMMFSAPAVCCYLFILFS